MATVRCVGHHFVILHTSMHMWSCSQTIDHGHWSGSETIAHKQKHKSARRQYARLAQSFVVVGKAYENYVSKALYSAAYS